ncbi:branched-chain amino acid ABC transporter permease [uncultured Roseovarius sp.]|uniref:branched-chain amino acid ABC transporter permease n=1 Tax=uncultured Roseovarius sp. TaxID=293344 RepID=UPI000C389BDA|nr:branched-chain amino acid ABC transporter permease [Roseovarius sp.]MBD12253.1 branched-chain amino acid ABC transporter permease [Roseovarius sp.]|tara:strand:+ start:1365 stop:2297 length:933 start_codon:yes stop_codon:yes gene_type:complete
MKVYVLHVGLLALLLALHFVLPAYHHGNLARVMVLASYAMGYNLMFGYTGLLSLGHALFFAAGMYGMGLGVQHLGLSAAPALILGLVAGAVVSGVLAALALRTAGVAFMIVTLMFAQAGYLSVLYFGALTRGDEGFVIQQADRMLWGIDLSLEGNRYLAALLLFGICLMLCLWLVRSPFGRVLVAIRENEERVRMLGYDVFAHKFAIMVLSGTMAAAAGASYGLLFGYVGASFASVQYSIFPLLWVLLGGAGTVLGPFIGTLFMFYLIDLSSGVTTAYMLLAGVALVVLTLFAPQGLMGEVRRRVWRGLP